MKSTILVKLIPSNRDPGKTTAMRRCEGGNSFLTRPEEDSRPKQEYRPSRLSRLPGRSVKTILFTVFHFPTLVVFGGHLFEETRPKPFFSPDGSATPAGRPCEVPKVRDLLRTSAARQVLTAKSNVPFGLIKLLMSKPSKQVLARTLLYKFNLAVQLVRNNKNNAFHTRKGL